MSLPIKVRLTVWYLTLLAVILAAIGSFVFLRLKNDLIDAVDQSLEASASQILHGYEGDEPNFQEVSDAALRSVPTAERAAQLVSPSGTVLAAAGDLAVTGQPMVGPEAIAAALRGGHVLASVTLGSAGEAFRVLAVGLHRPGGDSLLLVASSLKLVDLSLHKLLVLFATGIPVALLLAGLGGWLIARRALLPVARMTAEAQEIRADRLGDRVAIPARADELQRLARTLNDMLGRLQEGVESQRQFVADASHDLRTPLTIMGAEIDVGLDSPFLRDGEARTLLISNREEVERMARMVDNLLVLASFDDGQLELLPVRTELRALAHEVVEGLRGLASTTGVRIRTSGDVVWVLADPERLKQVLTNLIENAVKYAGTGEQVVVSTWQREDEAGLTVSDTGPGIPAEAVPRIFDRFFRVDATRSSARQGSGLGLAICSDIVDAHGGRIWVESTQGGGTSFSVALPAR